MKLLRKDAKSAPRFSPGQTHYRLVVAVAAIGLAAASTATAGASECKLLKIAEWPVRLENNALTVEGAINRQNINVLLDTGSSSSFVMRSTAVRFGLPRYKTEDVRIGLGGETRLEIALIGELRIVDAVRENWRVAVLGEHDPGNNIGFVLGYDFLRQTDVEFDLANAKVRLWRPVKDCKSTSLAYWAPSGASEANLKTDLSDRYHPVVTVLLNGEPIEALLDSGAQRSLVSVRQAASLDITPETPGVTTSTRMAGVGERMIDSWIAPFESFTMGGETIRNPRIRFADAPRAYRRGPMGVVVPTTWDMFGMILGVDFLRAHRLLIAHSRRKIYFTYIGGSVFEPHDLTLPTTAATGAASDIGKPDPATSGR